MSRWLGQDQRPGAAETEGAFRERVLCVVSQWQEQLVTGGPSPSWVSAIAREAAELRAAAQSRGWVMAQHLLYVENVARNSPSSLPQALGTMAYALRFAQAPVASSTVPLEPQMGPGAPIPAGRSRPPAASSAPPPPSQPLPPSDAWPPAPPPLIVASQPAPPHPPGATLLSEASDASKASKASKENRPGATPSEPPRAVAVRPSPPPPRSASPLPESMLKPRPPPSLLGKSMLGLRAFRRKPDASAPSSGAKSEPAKGGGLFGFRPLSSDLRAKHVPWGKPKASPVESMPRRTSRPPRGAEPSPGSVERRGSRSSSRPGSPSKIEARVPPWFYALIAVVALLGVATLATIVALGRRPKEVKEPQEATANTTPKAAYAGPVPQPSVDTPSPAEQVTMIVHKRGEETPELRALLDLQGKLASTCRDDPATCGGGWTPFSRDALIPVDLKDFAPSSSAAPLPAWLKRLKLPRDLPVRDELALRASFDFNTKNIAGRQGLQARLFECSAYADIFDSTFIKYGAPAWLTAVVYQESACNPRATSPVGAKGLWQFMPESARAYGLRVVEGDVDERLNPVKATDAAVHFLTDMQRKLGAWDLTLAGYNMGPFGVVARLAQVGDNAGFWDLVHAHLLPEETAGYVPAIEAYALILDNVSRLQFSRDGKRLESTAEVVVKPGTRLSLVARTAATTTVHIRELNPEFLRDVVPEGETTVRVPDAEAHRAQAFLEAWTPDDNRDTCVPEDFDWGAKQFERSGYAKSCPQTGPPR